jgi:hypothetical protein
MGLTPPAAATPPGDYRGDQGHRPSADRGGGSDQLFARRHRPRDGADAASALPLFRQPR